MGWGPDEMGNYSYWGGKSNYAKDLEEDGSEIIEVSIGPISSNWDLVHLSLGRMTSTTFP